MTTSKGNVILLCGGLLLVGGVGFHRIQAAKAAQLQTATVNGVGGQAVTMPASGVSGLSAVATSGSYADLLSKPTIPVVPTKLSSFTNDVGYQVQMVTQYTFPAANLLALGTYTQPMTVAGATALQAGTCGWVGNIGTTANVTIMSPVVTAGAATIGYKNNAILTTGVALTLRCLIF